MDEECFDFDSLLDALLEDDPMDTQPSITSTQENPVQVIEDPPPKFKFTVTYDEHKSVMPNTIGRYRFKGYEPPKEPEVIFIPPFKPLDPEKNYQKQVFQSMDRIRLRQSDKRDTKIKEQKKNKT
jgi:hypothetical protein